jgi:hypothetical protein
MMSEQKTEQTERIYQAIGTVEGLLELSDSRPLLHMGETSFPVFVSPLVLKKHIPAEIQRFRAYPKLWQGKPSFHLTCVTESPVSPFILKGYWQDYLGMPYLVIYRNHIRSQKDQKLFHLVSVQWPDAPKPNAKFWELEAEFRDGAFVVVRAEGPFDPPPRVKPPKSAHQQFGKGAKYQKTKPQFTGTSPRIVKPHQVEAQAQASPLPVQEIRKMTIPTKIQITCKISEVPPCRELPSKEMEFFLADGERVLTVRMQARQFIKLTNHGFKQWIAAISGELGPATETGFELVNASIQVFEKRPKIEAESASQKIQEVTSVPPTSSAHPPEQKGEDQPKERQRKNLLSGVRLA